jgi:subtilisin family serine protease
MINRLVGLFLFALLLAAQAAWLAPVNARSVSAAPDNRYLVVLKDGGDARAIAAAAKAQPAYVYSAALNGFAAELTDGQLKALQRNPWVEYIEPDGQVTINGVQNMDASGEPWGLDRIDQRNLPLSLTYTYNYTASTVTAYILDTGIQANHPQFGTRAASVYDAYGGTGADCNGHGTHLAGIIGGSTYGVAKQVKLRSMRVLDCNGAGSWSTLIAALDWLRLNAQKPAVANLSIGGSKNLSVNAAVANLANSGIFVAVSSGSSNADACNYSPASAPEAYTAASSSKTDTRHTAANYGTCVDGYAPGVAIKSAWINSGVNTISGTSMSAAFVTGAAALYKSKFGDASSATVSAWINTNATPNVIINNPPNTPNRLLYVGSL